MLGIRKKLHPKEINQGKDLMLGKACFSMIEREKTIFCGVLKNAKLPDGWASNISRCVNLDERKVIGYKSHDEHFVLHYLLQVAIIGTLSNKIVHPLIHLCSFFIVYVKKLLK